MAGIHRSQVEELYSRPRFCKLRGIVWRRRKLLQYLPPNAGRWLFPLHQGAVSKIAFNKQNHLIVLHEYLAAAHIVEPALHERLDPILVLVSASAGRRDGGRNSGDQGFGVG